MNHNNSSLPPRLRLRTSRSLPVVGTTNSSSVSLGAQESGGAAAQESAAASAAMNDEESGAADGSHTGASSIRPGPQTLMPGLPYDDSLSSTSMTSITNSSYDESTADVTLDDRPTFDSDESSWADTPESEVGYRIRSFDGGEEAEDDNDVVGDKGGMRRQLDLSECIEEESLPSIPPPTAPAATTKTTSHFVPQRGRSRRRRRQQQKQDSINAIDLKHHNLVRRCSSDTFDNATIGKGARKIARGSTGSSSGGGSGGFGGLLDPEMAWSITKSQLLQMIKAVLFALWVILSMSAVIHLHWFEDVGGGGGGSSGAHHHLSPIAPHSPIGGGLVVNDGPTASRKGRIRGGPIVPLLPPVLHRPVAPRMHIPLPLPPNKVSVVLMNYSRPRMVQESTLMRTLLSHPNVDEVILLHSNPNTAFHFVHPKVINVDSTGQNDEMGLSLRFYFCQLAKSDWVIHVDDDMEFALGTLSELLIEFARNPRRIVGRFGRDTVGDENSNFFNGYSSRSTHKQTEVVLTKLMVMERDTCGAFFEYSHLIWEDTVLNNSEGPLWNGEDIFMSLVANHVYGHDGQQANYAMDWLEVYNAPDSLKDYDNGKLDISGGMTGYRLWDWHWWQSLLRRNRHYAYRGRLWNTARRRLAESGEYIAKMEL